MEYAIIVLSFAVICLIAVSVIDYRWLKRIEHRLNRLDGAAQNNFRRQKKKQNGVRARHPQNLPK